MAGDEFLRKQVDRVFTDLLGHLPNAQQEAQGVATLRGPSYPQYNLTPSELLEFPLLAGSEFFFRQQDPPAQGGLHTNQSWTNAVYTQPAAVAT